MKKMKKSFKKVLAQMLVLAMCLTMLPMAKVSVKAAEPSSTDGDPTLIISGWEQGSIKVTKYATVVKETDLEDGEVATTPDYADRTATGTQDDEVTTGDTVNSYKTLAGAEFKLTRVATAQQVIDFYNGKDTTTYTVDSPAVTGDDAYTETAKTGDDGTYTFDGLKVGFYVLEEITAPDQITTPLAEKCLISVPMVNTAYSSNNDNAKWLYDVYVYPKNHEATGTIELTKVAEDNTTLVEGAKFELYRRAVGTTDWSDPITSYTVDSQNATLSYPEFITGADGKLKITNLAAGLNGMEYKLVEVSAPAGYIVNTNPIYFTVNINNSVSFGTGNDDVFVIEKSESPVVMDGSNAFEMTVRNEKVSVDKKVLENKAENPAWTTSEQFRQDATMTFKVETFVPYNVKQLKTYVITDTPSAGIKDSANVDDYAITYVDGTETKPLTKVTDYTLTTNAGTASNGFSLTLTDAGKEKVAGKTMTIIYKANMTAAAEIAGNGNENKVTVELSSKIDTTAEQDPPTMKVTDEVHVYTYQYKIDKRLDSATGDPGKKVEFELYQADKSTRNSFTKLSDGVYRLALAGETGVTTLVTSEEDGTLVIKGLENATYYLKEIKTVDTYNLLSDFYEIKVDLVADPNFEEDGEYTAAGMTVKECDDTTYKRAAGTDVTDTTDVSTIINKKGFVLPQTGSMGYLLFCVAGILLVFGGAVLMFSGRKKTIR